MRWSGVDGGIGSVIGGALVNCWRWNWFSNWRRKRKFRSENGECAGLFLVIELGLMLEIGSLCKITPEVVEN